MNSKLFINPISTAFITLPIAAFSMFRRNNKVSRLMFVFCTLFYATTVWGQSTNYSQVMANLLSRDECFKAMDYMKLYKDSIYSPEIQALYKFKMHGYMNRPDSSAYYLEKMLNDYPSLYLKDVTLKSYFSNILIGLYDEPRKKVIKCEKGRTR